MMKFRSFKMLAVTLGVVALGVAGIVASVGHQSESTKAGDSSVAMYNQAVDARNNAPWGFNQNPNEFFNTGGSNLASTVNGGGGYGPMIYEMNGSPTYLWTNDATFNLNQSRQLSFWIYMTPNAANADDGMAFALQPMSSNAHNNSGQALTSAFGGRTLGVWGNPDSKPWTNALPSSLAVEFDNVTNGEDGSKYFDKGFSGTTHIMAGYPSWSATYPTSDNGEYSGGLNPAGTVIPWNSSSETSSSDPMAGRWFHVSFDYNSGSKTLTYTWNDRDTDGDTPSSAVSGSVTVNQDLLNSTNLMHYGFTSATAQDENMVILDTDSNLVNATADATLTDSTLNKTITNESDEVYGGDKLTYTYTVNYNSGSRSLDAAHIKTTLPKYFVPDSDSSNLVSQNADGSYSVDQTLADSLSNNNKTATITINGKAADVETKQNVDGSDVLAVNGGLDQTLNNSGFTLMPGIRATATTTVKDTTVLGKPDVSDTKVFVGDELEYNFDLKYDLTSKREWSNVTANLFSDDEKAALDLDDATATVTYPNTGATVNLTANDLKNGYVIQGVMRDHPEVQIQVKTKATKATTLKDGSEYTNADHTTVPDASSFNVNGVASQPDGNLTITPSESLVDYTGLDGAAFSGLLTDTNANVSYLGVNVSVNGSKTERLVISNPQTASYSFAVPADNDTDTDSSNSSVLNGASVLEAKLDNTKQNVLTLQSIDGRGAVSSPVTVKAGKLYLSADSEMKFNDWTLSGDDQDVANSGYSAKVFNTYSSDWSLSATATKLTDPDTGKELPGGVIYRSGSGSTMALTDNAATIASDGNAVTTNVTKNWTNKNVTTESSDGTGMFVQVNGNAMPGDYTGQITWTLTDAPTK